MEHTEEAMIDMATDDRDPQPGDFDDELTTVASDDVQMRNGSADARVSIQVILDGEDAARLGRISASRGKSPTDVLSELLRDAELHAG